MSRPSGGLPGSLITCCFLLDRSRWGLEPLFDERFRISFEDHEAGLRARMLGHELLAVPAATCLCGEGTRGISVRRERVAPQRRLVEVQEHATRPHHAEAQRAAGLGRWSFGWRHGGMAGGWRRGGGDGGAARRRTEAPPRRTVGRGRFRSAASWYPRQAGKPRNQRVSRSFKTPADGDRYLGAFPPETTSTGAHP